MSARPDKNVVYTFPDRETVQGYSDEYVFDYDAMKSLSEHVLGFATAPVVTFRGKKVECSTRRFSSVDTMIDFLERDRQQRIYRLLNTVHLMHYDNEPSIYFLRTGWADVD